MPVDAQLDLLKQILENLRFPDRLDAHPWVNSLTVREAVARDASLAGKSPGAQLALTLGKLFRQMLPITPPQGGKRLDTRWGRFGILAANYFAPLLFGRMYPRTLREAWRRIDQAILLFVYDAPADQLKPEQVQAYRLVGDEPDLAANSTISDWHRGGLQDLLDLFLNRENHLSLSLGKPSPILNEKNANRSKQNMRVKHQQKGIFSNLKKNLGKWGSYLALTALLLALIFAAFKGWQIYQMLKAVKADISQLEQVKPASFDANALKQIGPLLDKTYQDVQALQVEVSPWLWLTDRLGWIPVYGGDLQYTGDLLETASDLTDSARQTLEIAKPVWDAMQQNGQDIKATALTQMLLDAQPSLLQAQSTLHQAMQARQRIIPERLSSKNQSLIPRLDSYLTAMDEALSLALAVPDALGGGNSGPKTYLILIQNEDELRPTGGFITSVAKAVIWKGNLLDLSIVDSYAVDDVTKPYPVAPWQLQSFMNIPVLTFRDSNWFVDYPTTVQWAEYLYAYTNSYSVNGVIAIDQHVLKTLLSVTGPVFVSDLNVTITSQNVEQVMRSQKIPPPPQYRDPDWYRKIFMRGMASAILERVMSGKGISWKQMLDAMVGELNQRHILVQLDNPLLSSLLSERGWDGAVQRTDGDFLAAVETNVGYNKTNAVVNRSMAYDVNLTDLSNPSSNLTVSYTNGATGSGGLCNQRPGGIDQTSLAYWYPIERCYYNYLRIYLPAGTQLTRATPEPVTRDEMVMLDQDVPARVDVLNEQVHGLQGFGTLMVVPMGQSLQTSFQFRLPVAIITKDPGSNNYVYQLKIQKQPGIASAPVTFRLHLPNGAKVISALPPPAVQDGSNLLFQSDLMEDLHVQVQFRP
jgi:hypothetical protein